jgi:hypothetical protein
VPSNCQQSNPQHIGGDQQALGSCSNVWPLARETDLESGGEQRDAVLILHLVVVRPGFAQAWFVRVHGLQVNLAHEQCG